jgi:trehalose 6-phosphate phosphatase
MGGHAGVNGTCDILAPQHIAVLRTCAQRRVLLAFDYDGTLSPIAPTPERALLPAPTGRLLTEVAKRYPTVVISGRALADIATRVSGIGVTRVFGNHGLESSGTLSHPHPEVRTWVEQLRTQLGDQPGVVIEDKIHSLSVHFRSAPDHEQALQVILPVVRTLPGVRIICGAAAVNLLPKDAANKGTALQRAFDETASEKAIYVGDDETDEDAFAALKPGTLLAIRIGASVESQARYHLDAQESIDLLLQAFLDSRNDR